MISLGHDAMNAVVIVESIDSVATVYTCDVLKIDCQPLILKRCKEYWHDER